jgi:hypothetical protein
VQALVRQQIAGRPPDRERGQTGKPGGNRLQGDVPTIELVMGYSKTNTSPLLKSFLSRVDEMIERTSKS